MAVRRPHASYGERGATQQERILWWTVKIVVVAFALDELSVRRSRRAW